MWPRVVEVMLGVWLAMSPFVFGHDRFAVDFACALLVVVLALLSFWGRAGKARLGQLAVGACLIVAGYLAPLPTPPESQNHVVVGWLLVMFGIIPNRCNEVPARWQTMYEGRC